MLGLCCFTSAFLQFRSLWQISLSWIKDRASANCFPMLATIKVIVFCSYSYLIFQHNNSSYLNLPFLGMKNCRFFCDIRASYPCRSPKSWHLEVDQRVGVDPISIPHLQFYKIVKLFIKLFFNNVELCLVMFSVSVLFSVLIIFSGILFVQVDVYVQFAIHSFEIGFRLVHFCLFHCFSCIFSQVGCGELLRKFIGVPE